MTPWKRIKAAIAAHKAGKISDDDLKDAWYSFMEDHTNDDANKLIEAIHNYKE